MDADFLEMMDGMIDFDTVQWKKVNRLIWVLSILSIALLLFSGATNYLTSESELERLRSEERFLRNKQCGGALYESNGSIQYNLGEHFNKSGDRCIWTIHSPNASKIIFEVLEDGIIQSKTESLKVGYFLDAEYKSLECYREVVLNYSASGSKVEVPGPVSFVQFHPISAIGEVVSGLGFYIKFTSVPTKINPIFKYSNLHLSGPFGRISHPGVPLERATFWLKPEAPSTLSLKYFDGNCGAQQDYLTVFRRVTDDYNRDTLQLLEQFCSSNVTSVPYWLVGPTDVMMITFQSGSSGGNKGFEITWTPSSTN